MDGRYVEIDITPPFEGRFYTFTSENGTLICYDVGLTVRYESADGGESWISSPGPGSKTDRYQSVEGGALMPDGSLLVFVQGEGLAVVASDGTSKPYPVETVDKAIADGENIMISQLEVMGDRLLLNYNAGGMTSSSVRQGVPIGGQRPATQGDTQGGPQPATQGDTQGGPQPITPGDTQGGPQPITPGDTQGGPQPATQGDREGRPASGSSSSSGGGYSMAFRPSTFLCDLKTGQVIAELQVENATASAYDGSKLYLMDMYRNVSSYKLSDGTPTGDPDIKFSGSAESAGMFGMSMRFGAMGGNVLAASGDGSLLAAYDGDLLRYDADGIIETVLESTAYSIGAPRSTVISINVLDDGGIVVNILDSNQNSRLYKYVWDENATVNPDKTITVWSLEDNNFVRAAIAQLRIAHPDSYIQYEVALDGSTAVSAADAIRKLNTELLSGGGPDVLILDGCSIDSYAGRGMLLDMSGLIDTSGVYDNLLNPYLNDGKLYCLPTQFMMPLLLGKPEALEQTRTLDDLVALVVNGNDAAAPAEPGQRPGPMTGIDEEQRAALHFDDLKELSNILWSTGAPDIVSDNKLDTAALKNYLEAVKAISDKYGLAEETSQSGRMRMGVAFSDGGMATALSGSLIRYTMRMTNYAAFSASNLQLLQRMIEDADSTMKLFPGMTAGTWQPSTVAAISADSGAVDFAAELVGSMLSIDVQRLNYGTGLPVTRAGIAAQIEAINDLRSQFGEDAFEFSADALINDLQIPSMVDTVLTDMMWNSVERCCKGEIDVEAAVREIEQNVKNYLAERA